MLSLYPHFSSFALILASVMISIACTGNQKVAEEDDMLPSPSMQTLSKGNMAGMDSEGGEVIICDKNEFEEFWRNLGSDLLNEDADIPEVDFDTFMVVGVFMGEQPSSGYDISIERVEQQAPDSLQLQVQKTEPGPDCMNMTVLTHPYHIIKINKTEAELSFSYDTEIKECG